MQDDDTIELGKTILKLKWLISHIEPFILMSAN